jgi:hypothetical protein
MQSAEDKPVLKCANIIFSPRGIAEVDGNKIIVFVPVNEIESITLKFGRSEHRPVASLSIGIILVSVGLFGLFELFWAARGWRYEIGMMLLGGIGGSIIYDVLKRRYFMEVTKKVGMSRLVFSKSAQKDTIEKFCVEVRASYKYDIAEQLAE